LRVGAIPETLLERIALAAGAAPTPIVDTLHAVIVARAVVVATRLDVFEALDAGPASAPELATRLGLNAGALAKLLNLLVATGYLAHGHAGYALSPLARKWLLSGSPQSLRDSMLLRLLEWQAIDTTEAFVRTGTPLDVHDIIRGDQWDTYQRGMHALARLCAGEVVRRVKLPKGATTMLDVGGGHGAYSVAFCREHPGLRATILDLPEAVAAAAPILAAEKMGARVAHRAGDALTDDFGEAEWDFILVAQLVHHFDARTNAGLVRHAAAALRPGGRIAILDVLRPERPGRRAQAGALLDLYFAVTSNSGTWSAAEIAGWFEGAGLTPARPIHLRMTPGISVMTATRRR
jgi:SAM-dependent methyltransferase